ncbi:CHAD domain-containing protein [Crenothrix polyspora]|uniref:CHAD domain-containing protein n=1 Tax=Crenothrix polyspora TaxID=360316 RepID=A0A1R4HEC7_9GAMM|nr:CHAD domain-containing protein [Crenothrix polyspora]SJM94595.1 CHAD domain-containing protein [Crenothrix polyspora]
MVTHFELPAHVTAEQLIASVSEQSSLHLVSKHPVLKTYYDSFDWRLYRHDIICEFSQSTQASILQLSHRKTSELIASTTLIEVPSFSTQFSADKMRQILEPVLEMRALRAICHVECLVYQFDIVNNDEKTVLRIQIEEFERFNHRLSLFPIKGYDKVAGRIVEVIAEQLKLCAIDRPLLLDILKSQSRHPKDYSSKLDIPLSPDMRADIASKLIFSNLLHMLKVNESGTIANIDTEFLHDFRVAVRRTRVGLSQVKNTLPDDIVVRFKEFFSWLGQITSETRDLDVYLLNFEYYKKQVPVDLRASLDLLHELLAAKQRQAQKQLAKHLRSARYSTLLAAWEAYLGSTPNNKPTQVDAKLTIKALADLRIWKVYKRVIKEGEAIDQHTPPEALHRLRKTCKKLRYLMEFFQHLYAERRITSLIKQLKRLQDVLGDYQDYATQQQKLMHFSQEMQVSNAPDKTIMAMALLIEDFDKRKNKIRDHFTWQFSAFKKPENHTVFHALFATHHS